MVNVNNVGWFEIYVSDMNRAKSFYEAVFTVKLENLDMPEGFDMEMWSFAGDSELPGAPGALVKMSGVEPGVGGTLVYFSCEDCSVEESRVVEAGGKVIHPKMPIGKYGNISVILDTEGNTIGLHSEK